MDLTREEFINTYVGKLLPVESNIEIGEKEEEYTVPNESFTWVGKGVITPVKN